MPLKLRTKLDAGTIPTLNRWADEIETKIGQQGNDIAFVKTTANAASGGSGGPAIVLETNGTANSSQDELNIENGTGIAVTNPSGGNVQIALPTSGVSAGSYTLADITVNAEGIVTAASNGSVTVTGGVISKTGSYLTSGSDIGKLIAFDTNAAGGYTLVRSSTGGTTSTAFGTTPTVGDLITCWVFSSTSGACSLSGVCATWNALGTPQNRGDGFYLSLFWGIASSGSTVSVTGQGGSFPGCKAYEWSGNPASPTVVTTQGTGSGNPMGKGVNTTLALSLVISWMSVSAVASNTFTTGAGWTSDPATGTSTTWFVYGVPNSTGTQTPNVTFASSAAWGDVVASFTPGGGQNLTLTLPASPPSSTWFIYTVNTGIGTLTINPNGLELNGVLGNITCSQNVGHYITTDGTNYFFV